MSEPVETPRAFAQFIAQVQTFAEKGNVNFSDALDQPRRALLAVPGSAWALTFLSATRMQQAAIRLQNNKTFQAAQREFLAADLLARPLEAILAERQKEKEDAARLKEPPSPVTKAQVRLRESYVHFEAFTGTKADSPSVQGLQRILGAATPLVEVLGVELAREVLTAVLSTKDPNMFLPASEVIRDTLEKLQEQANTYDRWVAQRNVVVKGVPKGLLRRPVVDQEALSKIDQRLAEMRSANPAIVLRDIFRDVAVASLVVHDKKLGADATVVDIRAAWAQVVQDNAGLAGFTHAGLLAAKQGQLAKGDNLGPRDRPQGAPANTDTQGGPRVTLTPGQSILTPADIEAFKRRHG